ELAKEEDVLPKKFVYQTLVDKLSDSWKDYKLSFMQKRKIMNLQDTILHIKIEDKNRTILVNNIIKKFGHFALTCRMKKNNNQGDGSNSRNRRGKAVVNVENYKDNDVIVAMVSECYQVKDFKDWVVDSGATKYICAEKKLFSEFLSINNGNEVIYPGDSIVT
ncbi:hypothetical protein S83_070498, partial [Arachis hypogaea]